MSDGWPPRTTDPDGRDVVFDAETHLHLAERSRDRLIEEIDAILGAVHRPTFRDHDPLPDRERFYRQDFPTLGQWLRVVVDFSETPSRIVTAFVIDNDPRLHR